MLLLTGMISTNVKRYTSLPRFPNIRAVTNGRLLAVPHNRCTNVRGIKQKLFLNGIRQKILDITVILVFLIHKRIKTADSSQHCTQFSAGKPLFPKIDHLKADPTLLEKTLCLFGIKALPRTKNLNVHI